MLSIFIKQRHKDGLQPSGPGSISTSKVGDAAIYMWGKTPAFYQMFINGREYGWPPGLKTTDDLHAHIEYCVEFDEAFYG